MNIGNKYLKIDKNLKIKDLIAKLDNLKKNQESYRIAIKFDKKNFVDGVISLGDLRRLIYRNKQDKYIYDYLNHNPYFLIKRSNIKKLDIYEKKFKEIIVKNCEDIFIYDNEKRLIDILSNSELNNDYSFKSICIVGLGHIGLPLMVHLLKKSNFITGYDINKKTINDIKNLNLSFFERGLNPLLKYNFKKNKINLTNNLNRINSNIYIICLGSDLKNKKIDNKNLISTLKKIGKKIYKNNLILIRGTTQVGFTNMIAKKILEKESRLVCGHDFFLGHMPERIVEGNAINELENLPQIISGSTENCLNRSLNFCKYFFQKVINTVSCEESEIIKLSSNAYRDLNFAIANEISRIANLFNLSGHDLINKANLGYERNSIAKPGLGVGGFCLPKDVFLFNKMSEKKVKGYQFLISRIINDNSLERISNKIIKIFKQNLKKSGKILILGGAFKGVPETIDIRNSSSIILSNKLSKKGIKNFIYDVKGKEIVKVNNYKKNFIFNINKISNFDFIILSNNNPKYRDIFLEEISKKKNKTNKKKFLFDCWNMLDHEVCRSAGYEYFTI